MISFKLRKFEEIEKDGIVRMLAFKRSSLS